MTPRQQHPRSDPDPSKNPHPSHDQHAPGDPGLEPWRLDSSAEWAQAAVDALGAGTLHAQLFGTESGVVSIRVWGACPRCGDEVDFSQLLTVPMSGLSDADRGLLDRLIHPTRETSPTTPRVPAFVDVNCRCGAIHPGAPKSAKGCGLSFSIPTAGLTEAP